MGAAEQGIDPDDPAEGTTAEQYAQSVDDLRSFLQQQQQTAAAHEAHQAIQQ